MAEDQDIKFRGQNHEVKCTIMRNEIHATLVA